jgi:hypothetical protein
MGMGRGGEGRGGVKVKGMGGIKDVFLFVIISFSSSFTTRPGAGGATVVFSPHLKPRRPAGRARRPHGTSARRGHFCRRQSRERQQQQQQP